MTWKPQPHSEIPIFRQIFHYYEEKIVKGELSPGAKLPAERELAIRLSVNRSTVSAAFEELRATGLVSSVQGSGTRVSEDMWETAPHMSPNWQRYTTNQAYHPAMAIQNRIIDAFSKPGIINMTKGELSRDLMPLEWLQKLTAEVDFSQPYSYFSDFRGDLGLRQALSAFLAANMHIQSEPEQILITAGVKHSLHLIAHTLLQPGDAIAVEGPSYLYALQVFAAAGLRMVKLPVDEHGLLPEAIPDLYQKHRIRMVFTNPTFQNPTGTTLTLARRQKLLAICEQLRLPILEDDPYGLIHFDNTKTPLPALKAISGGERSVIYVGTMSKIVSPGMRIGWIIAPKQVIAKLAEAKNRMGFSTSHAGERLAQLYINSSAMETQLKLISERLALRRTCLLDSLKRFVGPYAIPLNALSPAGGFYVWIKLRSPIPDKELVEAGIREGVLFQPGSIYGAEKGFLRLTFASIGEEEIVEGTRRLSRALRDLR
jgi:GntR family transcriptional regulator of abcA and norABC